MGEQNLSLLLLRAGPPLCKEAEPRPGGRRGVTGAAAEVGGCTRPSGNGSAETVTLENEEEPGTGFSCEQWGRCWTKHPEKLFPEGQGCAVEGCGGGGRQCAGKWGQGTHWLAEGLGL